VLTSPATVGGKSPGRRGKAARRAATEAKNGARAHAGGSGQNAGTRGSTRQVWRPQAGLPGEGQLSWPDGTLRSRSPSGRSSRP
jgi:hypothetical protein